MVEAASRNLSTPRSETRAGSAASRQNAPTPSYSHSQVCGRWEPFADAGHRSNAPEATRPVEAHPRSSPSLKSDEPERQGHDWRNFRTRPVRASNKRQTQESGVIRTRSGSTRVGCRPATRPDGATLGEAARCDSTHCTYETTAAVSVSCARAAETMLNTAKVLPRSQLDGRKRRVGRGENSGGVREGGRQTVGA
jgi:hypothetical protein